MMTLINRSGKGVQIKRDWIEQSKITHSELGSRQKAFKEAMGKVLLEDRPMLLRVQENLLPEKIRDSLLYLEPVVPSPRLVIAGAGHIGQAVAHLGRLLQFEVIVVDDRPEFANPERIPDADAIIVEDIPQALANFPVCQDTYIVIVTRGHSFDTETLRACISSPAAYIGMIGSRRKVKLIRKSFLKEGWASAEEFDRVYAPIGLEINSKTVEEIAVSIAAQLILVRSGKKETKGKDK